MSESGGRRIKRSLFVDQHSVRFLTDHLGLWIGAFAQAVQDGADTGFYRELGALTQAFMGFQMRDLAAGH